MTDHLPVDPKVEARDRAVYALGHDPQEWERLKSQAAELRSYALFLLDQVHLQEGGSAIDLGCGPLGILDLLSARVGPTGRVVGLDSNAELVAIARELTEGRAEVVLGDARQTGLPSSSFDLVHGRTLLINVVNPEEVAAEMARLARPGGYVALQELDAVLISHPAHPAVRRLEELLQAAFMQQGVGGPHIGRRLPEILRRAGLVDVEFEVRADAYPPGHTKRALIPDLVRIVRPKLVERGLASERELDDLDREARAHFADPDTVTVPHLFFLAWARKAP